MVKDIALYFDFQFGSLSTTFAIRSSILCSDVEPCLCFEASFLAVGDRLLLRLNVFLLNGRSNARSSSPGGLGSSSLDLDRE